MHCVVVNAAIAAATVFCYVLLLFFATKRVTTHSNVHVCAFVFKETPKMWMKILAWNVELNFPCNSQYSVVWRRQLKLFAYDIYSKFCGKERYNCAYVHQTSSTKLSLYVFNKIPKWSTRHTVIVCCSNNLIKLIKRTIAVVVTVAVLTWEMHKSKR